jgi:hypothetical protein
MDITIYAIPAVFALVAKAVIYFYARSSRLENLQTRLYLFFLFALSIQNLAEVFVLGARERDLPTPQMGTVYFGASIIAVAFLLHLALVLARSWTGREKRWAMASVYGPAVVLEVLLWSTPLLVAGFEPLGYTYTRIPGPLYFLFEAYAVGYLLGVLALLAYGGFAQTTPSTRTKNKLMLLGIVPPILVVITVISLQHLGIRLFNTTVVLPIAFTFLLVVTAYAIHQHRLFDIEFFIPGSKVRRRKTVFYQRIQAMIAEIADLNSMEQAVRRLADTLGCSVALIGGNRPVLAQAGASAELTQIPRSVLQRFDHIVVANEIADTLPEVHKAMRTHGVAAIVPFHPHSHHAAGWLVLGESFSEQVYTARDFRLVVQLFAKMADLFLDKLITMRTQLADAMKQIRLLERRQQELHVNVELLQQQNVTLLGQNELLRKQQPVDSLGMTALPAELAPSVCILGRDKALVKALRQSFPQAAHYVSATSAGFKRQGAPDLLIAHLGDEATADAEALAAWLDTESSPSLLLAGAGAPAFAAATGFGARLVETVPSSATDDLLTRRAQALAELRRATHSIADPEQPLIGHSPAFTALLTEVRQVARLVDPVVLHTDDAEQGLALAAYIHAAGSAKGGYVAWRGAEPGTADDGLAAAVAASGGGTLAVEWSAVPDGSRTALRARRDVRLLVVAPTDTEVDLAPAHPFIFAVPGMRERRADLPLLVHYFTLAFNLRTGGHHYLRQAEIDEMLHGTYPHTVSELRRTVHEALMTRLPGAEVGMPLPPRREEKTLDQHIAEYEAYLIQETLQRCGGNKSQAARLLGLRPNTLHYKLARHVRAADKEE